MDELVVRGSPVEFEVALGRALRGLQVLIVVPATTVLWWWEAWWWLPLPLAGSVLVYEALFAGRRDRPTRLALGPDGVTLADAMRGQALELRWDAIEVASTSWHRVRGGYEGVVMLAAADGPRVGLRFLLQARPDLQPGDVDLDRIDVGLGGPGGQIPAAHAVAPFEAIARQRFEDPRGLAFLRRRVPEAAWERAAARTWSGEAPPLDPFGYQLGDPDGWLLFHQDRWTLRARDGAVSAEGTLRGVTLSTRARPARLRLQAGEEPVDVEVQLVGIALPGGPRVHVPATGAGLPEALSAPSDLHTHFPEGGALIAHLVRWVPAADLPDALRALRPA